MKMRDAWVNLQFTVNYLNQNAKGRWEIITPAVAGEYLKYNTNNYRTVKRDTVEGYKTDIESGRWEINAETITFNENGVLENGQHRLTAIMKANKPLICYVVRGVPETSIYDRGKVRSHAEILSAAGYTEINTLTIAAANTFITGFCNSGHKATKTGIGSLEEVFKTDMHLFYRAYSLCLKGSSKPITKNASVLACVFSVLKHNLATEETIANLFKVTNTGFPIEGIESSSGLALKMSIQDAKNIYPSNLRRKYLYDATYQAISDFQKGVVRKKKYGITTKSEPLFTSTRRKLGLE